MEWVSRWRHRINLELGRALDRIRLNSIRAICVDGVPYVAKRRRWYAPILIVVGNAYLRQLGARTRFLSNPMWHPWEIQIYRAAYGHELATDTHHGLLIPCWTGTVLRDYLSSPDHSTSEKLQAVKLAAESLRQLHQLNVCWADGRERPFSHGDATIRNVMLTESPLGARWFDFDMTHDESQPDTWRHADDLRALVFSAAEWFPDRSYADLATAALSGYGNPSIIEDLAGILRVSTNRPNSFHLAQAGLTYDQNRQCHIALFETIRVPFTSP